jgi:hypothetical protein
MQSAVTHILSWSATSALRDPLRCNRVAVVSDFCVATDRSQTYVKNFGSVSVGAAWDLEIFRSGRLVDKRVFCSSMRDARSARYRLPTSLVVVLQNAPMFANLLI